MPDPAADDTPAEDTRPPEEPVAEEAGAEQTSDEATAEATDEESKGEAEGTEPGISAPGDGADDEQPVDLPQRFDGSFRLGRFDGGATLVVDQGELRLQPDSSLMAQGGFGPLTHRDHVVRVYAARWQPPTSNTAVLVEDGDEVALVDLPGWDRKRLRAALAAAGFERDETTTDLRLGHDLVRPKKRWWD